MCGMLNAGPPITQSSYDTCAVSISDYLAEMADRQQKSAAVDLKIALSKEPDDIVHVMVT